MAKMKRSEWVKTPYAGSSAQDPDGSIRKLLMKYRVTDIRWSEGTGASGRPACMVEFHLNGKNYRIGLEGLDADASREELIKQVKRAVYHMLKTLLEASEVFFPLEQVLLPYMMLTDGLTMYEAAAPRLLTMNVESVGKLLLPAPKE
jgi:hypothetical protein